MAEVECPRKGCGYDGSVKSVEAHISANQDDAHEGEVGRSFREDLLAAAEGRETTEESSEAGGSSGSPDGVAEAGAESSTGSSSPASESSTGSSSPASESRGGSSVGMPALSTGTMVAIAVVAVVVVVVVARRAGGSDQPAPVEEEPADGTEEEPTEDSEGLY